MNLFVYGQLTRAAVLFELLGRLPSSAVAVLPGYCRRPNPASGYFVVRAAADAEVAGLVLRDLSRAEEARLDAYEGVAEGDYCRVAVQIEALDPPGSLDAEVYVVGAAP